MEMVSMHRLKEFGNSKNCKLQILFIGHISALVNLVIYPSQVYTAFYSVLFLFLVKLVDCLTSEFCFFND